jgi:putative oxidoreductase
MNDTLFPVIHVFCSLKNKGVDARNKSGHDGAWSTDRDDIRRAASRPQKNLSDDVGTGIPPASLGRARQQMPQERTMTTAIDRARWTTPAILAARLIFALVFIMAVSFKLIDINATATYIASAGFPLPKLLAWLAALLELALIAGFLSGAYFSETALLAAAYVLFLGFAFHGPSHWEGNQSEFGFFVDHFTFVAGLLFAAAHGPGRVLAMQRGWIARQ